MFVFKPKLFLYLLLSFMIMTVVGTLSHELGHYTAARLLGYKATVNYKSTDADFSPLYDRIMILKKNTPNVLQLEKTNPVHAQFSSLNTKLLHDSFLVTIGGPLQTMLTGSFGLVCLFIFRKRLFTSEELSIKTWLLIFTALFWLRQPANACMYLAAQILYPSLEGSSDEHHIAFFLDWPSWSILLPTALIGTAVLGYVIYILPKALRLTFLAAGVVGGILGFAGWFFWLGKVLMP